MFPLGARKVSQFQAPPDSGSPSSSPPRGQLGARLIQVHLERLDNTGALAAVEIEVMVAGTEPLDLVAFLAAGSTVFPSSKATLRPRVSPKNRTAAAWSPGRDALPDQTFGSL
jgi:hypothetical protein